MVSVFVFRPPTPSTPPGLGVGMDINSTTLGLTIRIIAIAACIVGIAVCARISEAIFSETKNAGAVRSAWDGHVRSSYSPSSSLSKPRLSVNSGADSHCTPMLMPSLPSPPMQSPSSVPEFEPASIARDVLSLAARFVDALAARDSKRDRQARMLRQIPPTATHWTLGATGTWIHPSIA